MNESMPNTGDASGSRMSQVREKASHLAEGAKEQVRAQYDERKDVAVGELGSLASGLRRLVDDLSASNPNNVSGKVVSTIADRIESFGPSLEGRDLDNNVSDVERCARRNPAAFLGGAVALGFLASRFLKSSAPAYYGSNDFYSSDAYGGSHNGRTDSAIGNAEFTGGAGGGLYGGGALDTTSGAYGTPGSIGSTGSLGTSGGIGTGSDFGTTGSTTGTTGTSGTRSSLDTPGGTIPSSTDFDRTGKR